VVGDRLYGAVKAPAGLPPLERFYLHAREIGFEHPSTGEPLRMTAPLPAEFTELLRALAL
jgi:23S rRNA pseudouridine1911/1915/1917 synthase